jgi:hypothetical protein
LELIPGEFAIAQDLSQESAPNRVAAVYRYDCAPAIRVTQEMVPFVRITSKPSFRRALISWELLIQYFPQGLSGGELL